MGEIHRVNPSLLFLAGWRLKQAFVPSDAASGGAPPTDPSGGAGGAPPPADPSGGAGASTAPQPDISTMIQQAVQTAMQQNAPMGAAPGAPGAAPGAAGAMGKPAKPDLNVVAMDVFQVKKILSHICRINGWELPPDVIDGPNRDPSTGVPMPAGAAGSTSDPSRQADPGAAGAGVGQGGAAQSAIPPVQPMDAAMPVPPGGKTAAVEKTPDAPAQVGRPVVRGETMTSKAAALSRMMRQLQKTEAVS